VANAVLANKSEEFAKQVMMVFPRSRDKELNESPASVGQILHKKVPGCEMLVDDLLKSAATIGMQEEMSGILACYTVDHLQ